MSQQPRSKGHRPPSRIRYEATHPTITVRLTSQLRDRIKALAKRSGKSQGRFLRDFFDASVSTEDRGYRKGWAEAKARYAVIYPCAVCKQPLEVTTPEAKAAASAALSGWGHATCWEQQRKSESLKKLLADALVREVASRALYLEGEGKQVPGYAGWSDADIRATPPTLTRLVSAGLLQASGADRGKTLYRLQDPALVAAILRAASGP